MMYVTVAKSQLPTLFVKLNYMDEFLGRHVSLRSIYTLCILDGVLTTVH